MAGVTKVMMTVAMVVVMMVAMGLVSVEGVSKVETNEAVFFSIGDWGDGSAKQVATLTLSPPFHAGHKSF